MNETTMPVRLRGHHFLCLLTFKGLGYTPEFVANMKVIAAAITAGRPVQLVEGPDDICAGLSPEAGVRCDHDCSEAETREDDRLAVDAVTPFIGAHSGPFVLSANSVRALRSAFRMTENRKACIQCDWMPLCNEIAADAFKETLLFPSAVSKVCVAP